MIITKNEDLLEIIKDYQKCGTIRCQDCKANVYLKGKVSKLKYCDLLQAHTQSLIKIIRGL